MVPRTPLGPINSNRVRKTELSPNLRGQITGQASIGCSITSIAKLHGLSTSTIQFTLDQQSLRADGKTLPRTGRPPIPSEDNKSLILRLITRDPFILYSEIREQSGLTVSDDTLLRMLKSSGYGHWKARKRPYLKPEVAALRLTWALEHRNWTWEDWKRVVWSDECSVEIGKGKRARWVFHLNHRNEKWKKEYVVTYSKSKRISIMIWGAIFGGGYSDLYQMNRDPFSARQGFSSQSYLETLEENLPQFFMNSERIFMHDNAPIHTAKIIKAWLWENAIPITDWPPYSPDLNPIEHAWAKLKEMIDRLDPDLDKFEGTKEQLVTHFQGLIHKAWEELGQDYFDRLIQSMNRRCEAVIAAEGWYTRY